MDFQSLLTTSSVEMSTRSALLYVRNEESIRVVKADDGLSLEVSGPGHERHTYAFGDTATTVEFMRLHQHVLVTTGWVVQAFIERRSGGTSPGVPRTGDRRKR